MNEFDLRKFLYNNPLLESEAKLKAAKEKLEKQEAKLDKVDMKDEDAKEKAAHHKKAIKNVSKEIKDLEKDLAFDKKAEAKEEKEAKAEAKAKKKKKDVNEATKPSSAKMFFNDFKDEIKMAKQKFGKDADKVLAMLGLKEEMDYYEDGDVKEDEQFVGNDINANKLLNILKEYLPTSHYHQDKTLRYDEALNMVAEFVKFTGMDSTGEDFLNYIMDTEGPIKEDMGNLPKSIRDIEQARIEKDARKKGLTKEGLKDMIREKITSILNEEDKDMAEDAKYYEDDMQEAEEVDVDVDEKDVNDVDVEDEVRR